LPLLWRYRFVFSSLSNGDTLIGAEALVDLPSRPGPCHSLVVIVY